MPIRNTILFCPEVVQEISNNLKREYSLYKLNDTEISYIQKKKTLKSESEKHIVELFEKHIAMKKTADDFSEDISSFSDNCTSFMEYMQENTEMIQRLIIKRKGLTHLKKELKNWLNIIGIESELGSEIEVGSVLLADYDEADNDFDDDNTSNLSSHIIMGNILIEEHNEEEAMFDSNNIELMLQKLEISASSTQNVSGVFYIDNGYHRVTVEEYRKKCPLEEV